uniref:zinc finger protein 37-like n=1 Tax=Euleptes europaea TaxID=460621 RepID=UPI00254120D9|nr:zinc finger protein 37-like [Euleptes europaea]
MAAEEQEQDPAIFEEVSVSVIEEMEFPLDPSLLALSGKDVQQYCTMLSLMEFQNIKPAMFLKTQQGEMPLSLVTVVEEYEVGPWSYEGNESVPFDLPQQGGPGPQVRIQYDFVRHSEGGILQGNPSGCLTLSKPEQGTDLQTSENESVASGGNLSMCSMTQLEHGLRGNSNTAFLQQEGFRQPNEMDFTAEQGYVGLAPEQNNTQNVSESDLLLGNDLRTAGLCDNHGAGDVSIHQEAHQGERNNSCNSRGESVSERPSSVVPESSHAGETLCPCPNCGRVLSLNEYHVTHPAGEKLYNCSSCGYLFSCNAPDSAECHQVTLTDDWERLFCRLDLNHRPSPTEEEAKKRFHCPDCGKGFVHKSSIPRHQRLHRKENLSQNSGQENSRSPAGNPLGSPKAQSEKKPLSRPDGGSRPAGNNKDRFAALCEVCGQSFSLASKFQKHLAAHSEERPFCCCHCGKAFSVKSVLVRHLLLHQPEKPFQCLYCEKGYIQKCHLNRHYQMNHRMDEGSEEGVVLSVGLPQADVVPSV